MTNTCIATNIRPAHYAARTCGSSKEETGSGDQVVLGGRVYESPANLEHIATTSVSADEVSTPEGRQAVADDLVAAMESFPSKTMVVGVVNDSPDHSEAIVAGPAEALTSDDTLGIFEFVQRVGSSQSIKDNARAFPSSYNQVTAFDPAGKTDVVRLPGAHDVKSVNLSLAEGLQANNEEMIRDLIDSLPKDQRSIVLIGGPSGAGKSFLIRRIEELAGGRDVVKIEGDNYFMDVDNPAYPRTPDDNFYWDHYDVLDHELVKENFTELVTEGTTQIPVFDFQAIHGDKEDWDLPITGVRTGYDRMDLGHDDILVFDSLHATNPDLLEHFADQGLPVVAIYLDTPSANDRLVRRIVRDYHHRGGQTPEQTIGFWDATTRPGETEFIRPSMKALDVSRDVFVLSQFDAEPHISRQEIEERSAAMADYGLMPEYETYGLTPGEIPEFARAEEARFESIINDLASEPEDVEKARKGLDLIRSAPNYQGE